MSILQQKKYNKQNIIRKIFFQGWWVYKNFYKNKIKMWGEKNRIEKTNKNVLIKCVKKTKQKCVRRKIEKQNKNVVGGGFEGVIV